MSVLSITETKNSSYEIAGIALGAAAVGTFGSILGPSVAIPPIAAPLIGIAIVATAVNIYMGNRNMGEPIVDDFLDELNGIFDSDTDLSQENENSSRLIDISQSLVLLLQSDIVSEEYKRMIVELLLKIAELIGGREGQRIIDILKELGYIQGSGPTTGENTSGGGGSDGISVPSGVGGGGGGGGGSTYACFGYNCGPNCYGTFCYPTDLA